MSLLRDLAIHLRISQLDVFKIVQSAPRRYKTFTIPKRSGKGDRIIAQPARELKAIQRFIVSEKLAGLRIHRIATAYRAGQSIRENVEPHIKNSVILKLDFKDFFHSFIYPDLVATLSASNFKTIPPEEWPILRLVFFWQNPADRKLCLSIGAPSSPFLSNVIMERIDKNIADACERLNVVCTRYADDITLSGDSTERLVAAEQKIRGIIEKTKRPSLTFNDEKRGLFTKASRRMVTGLVLTPEQKISLGRDRKREISVAIHHIESGKNVKIDHLLQTRGWLAYAKGVEQEFFNSMMRKYPKTVSVLMNMPTEGAAANIKHAARR